MIESCDSNILFAALSATADRHAQARAYLDSQTSNRDFRICEFALAELYALLRNPTVMQKSVSPRVAAEAIQLLRSRANWLILDYPGGLMDEVWRRASLPQFPRTGVFDARLALTLRHHGVTHFATRNVKHFQGYGFEKVYDPTV